MVADEVSGPVGLMACSSLETTLQTWLSLSLRRLDLVLAGASSQTHAPTLQRARLDRPCQNDVCCLVQSRAPAAITDLGYPAAHILFAGLLALRRHPKMCTNLPGTLETRGIVDRRSIGQRHQHAHARRRHQ